MMRSRKEVNKFRRNDVSSKETGQYQPEKLVPKTI